MFNVCSPATRELFVELPPELGRGPNKVGKLLRSMYGCRDAGLNWELAIKKVMEQELVREVNVVAHGKEGAFLQ